mmetsp:Transcript_6546/g.20311  ORF Transcript_6546/g.20311 Transcript_6546/m.20311 type:complete len:241 (+) Transcript_6546:286-1008(+)
MPKGAASHHWAPPVATRCRHTPRAPQHAKGRCLAPLGAASRHGSRRKRELLVGRREPRRCRVARRCKLELCDVARGGLAEVKAARDEAGERVGVLGLLAKRFEQVALRVLEVALLHEARRAAVVHRRRERELVTQLLVDVLRLAQLCASKRETHPCGRELCHRCVVVNRRHRFELLLCLVGAVHKQQHVHAMCHELQVGLRLARLKRVLVHALVGKDEAGHQQYRGVAIASGVPQPLSQR